MGAETNFEPGSETGELRDVRVAGVEEILLAKMAEARAGFSGDVRMVVNDQPDAGAGRHWKDQTGHPSDFVQRPVLGPQLDDVGAAVAKLLRHFERSSTVKVSRVNEGVEVAL